MKPRFVFLLAVQAALSGSAKAQVTDSLKNAVTVQYTHHHFDKQFAEDWRLASVEYKRQTRFGALIPRLNYARRLGHTGFQYELDAYPKFSKKLYAYFNAGHSSRMPVFPQWRQGLSLFLGLSKGWEAEGGYRFLYFDREVWIATAGLSKYWGNWLLNGRSYYQPSAAGTNLSYFFNARRYLKNERDHIWLQAGRGVSPDESRNIQIVSNALLHSTRLGAGAQLSLTKQLGLQVSANWSRDEFLPDTFGNQYFGTLGLSCRF
ncbi:YaiO family outer membrane beta-barrel protein [Paraflavisolibacter sp. H34]|uniref:YaiO family outer membrane beta-barrel protein n=1 Tax=Huijunlia imazamoxiresistens TaxID=3127457 RepID=UPI0030193B06